MEEKRKFKPKAAEVCCKVFPDGALLEQVKDYKTGQVGLVYLAVPPKESGMLPGPEPRRLPADKQWYKPIDNSIVQTNTVLFPSEPVDYGDTATLRAKVQEFIHAYVDLGEYFERLASYYVLLSWVYGAFSVVPYLRCIGEPGTGKSRFLKVVGSICYRPMFVSGAISVASIFRILEQFQGTLILDEADLSVKSDEYAAAVKILNCGFAKDTPVIRQEKGARGGYYSVAYRVYGPKIVATRQRFHDLALETRCITERMGKMRRRQEIPLVLPASFDEEALALRNQLLAYRFTQLLRLKQQPPVPILAQEGIEPRLSQITASLIQVMDDPAERQELRLWARQYTDELKSERGQSVDGDVLRALFALIDSGDNDLSVKAIAEKVNEGLEREADRLSNRYVGHVLRKVQLIMKRAPGSRRYVVDTERSADTLELLRKQYDIPTKT
ncbi:MAG: hypothetical protein FJ012_07930 [Chloroflexi bacterium]|nr:hypothetical protein [Chloroflexota bacterium]